MPKQSPMENIRHSLSHLLAASVLKKYPDTKLGIGPTIENGFYYDFLFAKPINETDLADFEKQMHVLIKAELDFKSEELTAAQAKKLFKDQPFKIELISELAKTKEPISIYKTGDVFTDLCRGGHVKNTKEINPDAFKLTHLAGAYWKGSEKNQMLTRIYGVAFGTKKELDDYLAIIEEAKKRDHRVLGEKLDLFIFSDLVGKGLPLFTEKGATIRRILERLAVDEEIKRGYKHVCTPDLAKVDLYKKSGHYPYYKNSMYPVMKIDDDELILRPMTCPHHYQIYLSKPRSYRELPFRIAEVAKQFRYEKSGELTGLIRVRSFCLADAHIMVQPEGVEDEMNKVLDLIEFMAKIFELKPIVDYRYRLSLGDRKDAKKYYKDDEAWTFAENVLRKVLKNRKAPFFEAENEAAFYGPKIDIQMKNFAGKEDTAFTVQYDFVGPKRFNLVYIDKDNKEKEAIVIHRSSIGCIERIMAFLIEKYAGAFPFWLSPVQIKVLPISEKQRKASQDISDSLKAAGFRAELDDADETLGKRIREAEMQKIPFILVIGDKEIESKQVAVRERGKKEISTMNLKDFIETRKNLIPKV